LFAPLLLLLALEQSNLLSAPALPPSVYLYLPSLLLQLRAFHFFFAVLNAFPCFAAEPAPRPSLSSLLPPLCLLLLTKASFCCTVFGLHLRETTVQTLAKVVQDFLLNAMQKC